MSFLAVLVVILFYRNWIGGNPLRDNLPFDPWRRFFDESVRMPNARYLACVGVPSLVIFLLHLKLGQWVLGLVGLLVSLVVLVYAIDVHDTDVIFDDQAVRLRDLPPAMPLSEAKQTQEDFQVVTTYEIFQGIYPALFWFLLLGPGASVFYVLSKQYLDALDDDDPEFALVDQVVFWMEWPAARLTGLVFAVVGRFGECMDEWLDSLLEFNEGIGSGLCRLALAATGTLNDRAEADVATFARDSEQANVGLKDLLDRTLFGWLGVAALFTVLGF